MSKSIGNQGRDLVIALLRGAMGRTGENYHGQDRTRHDWRASQALRRFRELCPQGADSYQEAINEIVDALAARKGVPHSPWVDPELRLCRAAILVYLDRLSSDIPADARLEKSRQTLKGAMHDYDRNFSRYFGGDLMEPQ